MAQIQLRAEEIYGSSEFGGTFLLSDCLSGGV